MLVGSFVSKPCDERGTDDLVVFYQRELPLNEHVTTGRIPARSHEAIQKSLTWLMGFLLARR